MQEVRTEPAAQPLISVIVPIYNKAEYLRACLESIAGQTHSRLEIICIDDASTDESLAIARNFERNDARVTLVRNAENIGPGRSRNLGLAVANGEFVMFVDADDLVPAASVATLCRKIVANGADLARGSLGIFYMDDHRNLTSTIAVPDKAVTNFEEEPLLWTPWWHTSYLMRTSLIRKLGLAYPNLSRGEDPVFMASVLAAAQRITLTPEIVYLYRKYPKTTGTLARSFAHVQDTLKQAALIKGIYLKRFPESWNVGFGPFFREDFREFLSGCTLTEAELQQVREAERGIFEGLTEAKEPPPSPLETTEALPSAKPPEAPSAAEVSRWNSTFLMPDPWNYASPYERQKYLYTLELLPDTAIGTALELGCAEGAFTELLAPRVGELLGADISDVALARAQQRCAGLNNVHFAQADAGAGIPGNGYDLIVCSELLYYLQDAAAVAQFAERAAAALAPGGHLLMTHANMVSDDRSVTGFDFNEIGAKFIGSVLAGCGHFEFARELRTELYRVQQFRKLPQPAPQPAGLDAGPREVIERAALAFDHPCIKRGGCVVTAAEALHLWRSDEVPILMYHRIAEDGPADLAPYRLSPRDFERQLAWLSRHGYSSMRLDDYAEKRFARGMASLPGKVVILTFDDAYEDFHAAAWPLLRHYGFGASLFVPTDYVGRAADWDRHYGEPARIMSWDQLREVATGGIEIGSHSASHQLVTKMQADDLLADATRAKSVLETRLGVGISGFCYPYAWADAPSRKIIGQAGYSYAVGGDPDPDGGPAGPLYLPRIEMFGGISLDTFISRLPPPVAGSEADRQRYLSLRARRDRGTYMT